MLIYVDLYQLMLTYVDSLSHNGYYYLMVTSWVHMNGSMRNSDDTGKLRLSSKICYKT